MMMSDKLAGRLEEQYGITVVQVYTDPSTQKNYANKALEAKKYFEDKVSA